MISILQCKAGDRVLCKEEYWDIDTILTEPNYLNFVKGKYYKINGMYCIEALQFTQPDVWGSITMINENNEIRHMSLSHFDKHFSIENIVRKNKIKKILWSKKEI